MKLIILILKRIGSATLMNVETESLLQKEFSVSRSPSLNSFANENPVCFLLRL